MKARMLWIHAVALLSAVLAGGCGGSSPTSSSGGGVAVEGVVLDATASVSAADAHAPVATAARKVTVKVEGTTLTVDVSGNGTFKLSGVPSGTFTLIFLQDGVEIGRVVVTAGDGSQVNIVVRVQGTAIVVVDLKVDGQDAGKASAACGVNGASVGRGLELEGNVTSGDSSAFKLSVNGRAGFPIDVGAAGAKFTCIGSAKTSSDAECKAAVKSGAKVHVSGSLASCTQTTAQVTASEVKVQK